MALVLHMPPDGALGHAEGAWSETNELLAAIVEQLDGLTRLTYAANSGGKAPPWKPVRVPRPGSEQRRPRTHESAERMASFLARGGER